MAPQATYWHRIRFELVGREAARARRRAILDLGAGAGLLGDWLATTHPELAYSFEETSDVLRDSLVRRFGDAGRGRPGRADRRTGRSSPCSTCSSTSPTTTPRSVRCSARMAPGTTLVITVPAMQWAFSSWDTELGHHRRYSRGQLRARPRGGRLRRRSR